MRQIGKHHKAEIQTSGRVPPVSQTKIAPAVKLRSSILADLDLVSLVVEVSGILNLLCCGRPHVRRKLHGGLAKATFAIVALAFGHP